MCRIVYFIVISGLLLLGACKESETELPDKRGITDIGLLRKYPETPILIKKDISINELKNQMVQSTTEHLRDSIWPGFGGVSKFYETDEFVVTPDNLSYIYPGSLIEGESVSTGAFAPVFGYKKMPITIWASFPTDFSSERLDVSSLSNTRTFLRKALTAPGFSGLQLEEFTYGTDRFSYYDELKTSFGLNTDVRGLFYSANSSFNYEAVRTNFSTAFVMKYTIKNFTLNIEDPKDGDLIDQSTLPPDFFYGYSPVYVSSVTYGRLGIIVIETNDSAEATQTTFDKVVRKLFKKSTESFSSEEEQLLSRCHITVYVLGNAAGANIQYIIGGNYENIADYIGQNAIYTADDPGVPIEFSFRYLSDHTLFKTIFKIDLPN